MNGEGNSEFPLLDHLAYRMQCDYVSDLRFLEDWKWPRLRRELQKLPVSSISLRQLNDTASYLTGETMEFASAEQAVRYLLNYGSRENDDNAFSKAYHKNF